MTKITTVAGLVRHPTMTAQLDTCSTLLPCPFCGHEGAFRDVGRAGHDHYTVSVECSNTSCGVKTPQHYSSRDTARVAWNRRQPTYAGEKQ